VKTSSGMSPKGAAASPRQGQCGSRPARSMPQVGCFTVMTGAGMGRRPARRTARCAAAGRTVRQVPSSPEGSASRTSTCAVGFGPPRAGGPRGAGTARLAEEEGPPPKLARSGAAVAGGTSPRSPEGAAARAARSARRVFGPGPAERVARGRRGAQTGAVSVAPAWLVAPRVQRTHAGSGGPPASPGGSPTPEVAASGLRPARRGPRRRRGR
jgi:hypothetical protein